MCERDLCQRSSGASLAKRPYLESRIEACMGGRKSAGGSVSVSFADAEKKGSCGVSTTDVSQSTASISSSFCCAMRLVCFPIFGSIEKHYPPKVCT